MRRLLLLIIGILLFVPVISVANPANDALGEIELENERYTVKLMILGPGYEIYTWWGHTGIVIEDNRTNRKIFYDFGNFSFEEENFYSNFLMGRLIYQGVGVIADLYLNYTRTQEQEMRLYTLNMTQEQAKELDGILMSEVSPENSRYLYDHFEDNCATRIRDYLNIVYDGRLEEVSRQIPAGSFRSQFRRFSYSLFPVDFLMNYLQGSYPDQDISLWDSQYLPLELEKAILLLDQEDSIIKSVEILSEAAPDIIPTPEKAPPMWIESLFRGLGVTLVLAGFWLLSTKSEKKWGRNLSWTIISLLSGIPGTILLLMTLFTDHHVTFHNLNLFYSSPLVFLGLFLYKRDSDWARTTTKILWTLLSSAALILLFRDILFKSGQQNGGVILFYLPSYLLLTLNSWGFLLPEEK